MRRFLLALALLAGPAAILSPALAQKPIDVNKGVEADAIGIETFSVGSGAETLLTAATATAFGPTAPGATMTLVSAVIVNTHATQTIYVLVRPEAGTAVGLRLPIAAGASVNLSGLLGDATTQISVEGSGAATTGWALTYWRR